MNPPTLPLARDEAILDTEALVTPFDRLERAGGAAGNPSWVFPLRKAGIARFAAGLGASAPAGDSPDFEAGETA